VREGLLRLKGSAGGSAGPQLRFHTLIGTGGIGTGSFFQLRGDHTLGREESRGGHFLDRRDYCKLHIVCHYLKALLGDHLVVMPIGKVGEDEPGAGLLQEMKEVGLDLRFVDSLPETRTLYSFCFLYPDGSGGNMTTEDSASGQVNPRVVGGAEEELRRAGKGGIALAVPEVPLAARQKLLDLATQYDLFRVASFSSGEMEEVRRSGLPERVDLLALNQDEARRLGQLEAETTDIETVIERLSRSYPHLLLSVTAGAAGSWSWDGTQLLHLPAISVPVITTGGAGDAHLAGIIAGLAADLPLSAAHRLGVILAAASVTCPHTIYKEIDRQTLYDLASLAQMDDDTLNPLLEGSPKSEISS
jgi:sugar/nucleoside kinase (ribokinase family)